MTSLRGSIQLHITGWSAIRLSKLVMDLRDHLRVLLGNDATAMWTSVEFFLCKPLKITV